MKFLNEKGQEITLKQSVNLPGYEVVLAEDTIIESAVNNPFFKGINVLQLPKKLKGFRENEDLKKLLEPQILNSGVILSLNHGEFGYFQFSKEIIMKFRLVSATEIFGNNELISPMVVNMGLKNIKLKKNTIIGTLIGQNSILL
ncbi:hypothetical protein [Weissella paramesenteroides]|uniref:hypothetical protein n=1 Tax=Weissella paramesenteroides TaxID=1249 RepID=UPI001D177FB2|nr:hypothetical protein [Weissella paramesenteroides]MDF8372265.1 hypothetical protein [Weissella paramesenteroides]UEG66982.1 hypothetical protein GZH44_00160 [Weissella hellenica]WIG66052.1 hypothetical protein G9U56_03470 [Weissella paramesenteroides]